METGKVNPHKNPLTFTQIPTVDHSVGKDAEKELFYWKILRIHYSSPSPGDQRVFRFIGHTIKIFANLMHQKTRMTFLPPIQRPITDFTTVLESIKQSQRMAHHSNMTYVHIIVDVGAATK